MCYCVLTNCWILLCQDAAIFFHLLQILSHLCAIFVSFHCQWGFYDIVNLKDAMTPWSVSCSKEVVFGGKSKLQFLILSSKYDDDTVLIKAACSLGGTNMVTTWWQIETVRVIQWIFVMPMQRYAARHYRKDESDFVNECFVFFLSW